MGERVGLIGVGLMGTALMSRLHAAGREVQAYDISSERMEIAKAAGAHVAATAADAAKGVPFVHIFVRTDDELTDVTLGKGGVLAAVAKGAIVFLHSTVMPATSRSIAGAAQGKGIGIVDAPITAVPRVVAEGNAVFLIGGDDAVAKIAVPYLQPLGRSVHHFGPVGTGNAAKIVKNLINANERIALAEAAAIAEASGLDVAKFLDMAAAVDRGSTVGRWQATLSVEGNHVEPRPASNLYNKDIGLAADLARVLTVRAPMTQAAADTAKTWLEGWAKSKK
jgi:3-hydroxyisobutyrate dehydrogenase-like beta-hydroxyacid dehydrogenase